MNEQWNADLLVLRRTLRRFFQRRVRDESDDLLQQTLMQLLEAQHRLRDEQAGYAYAFAIAKRVLFAHYRHSERRRVLLSDEGTVDALALGTDEPSGEESQALFRLSVASLPEDLRDVLHMSYWDGMSRSQIADSLGLPAGTVASRLRRGLGLLREELRGET